jgi:hypothetical protein
MSNNNTFMEELERILVHKGIQFNAQENHVRCYPHIINLCAQAVVASLSMTDFWDDDEKSEHPPEHQMFEEAIAHDPIGLARRVVVKLRSSGKIRMVFHDIMKVKGYNNPQQLICDVKTCWDSTFHMISCFLKYKDVCFFILLSEI